MPATKPLTANTVSAKLRRAGFNPLGSGASRMRQGLRVRNSFNAVYVSADLDGERAAQRLAADAAEALRELGYTVDLDGTVMRVTR